MSIQNVGNKRIQRQSTDVADGRFVINGDSRADEILLNAFEEYQAKVALDFPDRKSQRVLQDFLSGYMEENTGLRLDVRAIADELLGGSRQLNIREVGSVTYTDNSGISFAVGGEPSIRMYIRSGDIIVSDINTQDETYTIANYRKTMADIGMNGGVDSVTISRDRSRVLLGTENELALFRLEDMSLIARTETARDGTGRRLGAWSVGLSADSDDFIISTFGHGISVFDGQHLELKTAFVEGSEGVFDSFEVSSDGRYAIGQHEASGQFEIRSLGTDALVFRGHMDGDLIGFDMLLDGEKFYIESSEDHEGQGHLRKTKVYDVKRAALVGEVAAGTQLQAMSSEGRFVIGRTGNNDMCYRYFLQSTHNDDASIELPQADLFRFTPSGEAIIMASSAKVQIYDIKSREIVEIENDLHWPRDLDVLSNSTFRVVGKDWNKTRTNEMKATVFQLERS